MAFARAERTRAKASDGSGANSAEAHDIWPWSLEREKSGGENTWGRNVDPSVLAYRDGSKIDYATMKDPSDQDRLTNRRVATDIHAGNNRYSHSSLTVIGDAQHVSHQMTENFQHQSPGGESYGHIQPDTSVRDHHVYAPQNPHYGPPINPKKNLTDIHLPNWKHGAPHENAPSDNYRSHAPLPPFNDAPRLKEYNNRTRSTLHKDLEWPEGFGPSKQYHDPHYGRQHADEATIVHNHLQGERPTTADKTAGVSTARAGDRAQGRKANLAHTPLW